MLSALEHMPDLGIYLNVDPPKPSSFARISSLNGLPEFGQQSPVDHNSDHPARRWIA